LTPEKAVAIQELLGADIAMQLDHVIGLPAARNDVSEAMERSLAWGERCLKARRKSDQAMFGIVQGGLDPELRAASAQHLRSLPFEGFAVGGLSVGEGQWLPLFRQQFHIYQRTSHVILWGLVNLRIS
jgi:queuine tRNA-ribosyltransferase